MPDDANAPPQPKATSKPTTRRLATRLVRDGVMRSDHGETSEAIFMTSGYAYPSAEEAARRLGENDDFTYSRYGNPTVRMLEARLCSLEGAQGCRVAATGMAAIHASLAAQVQAGDRIVGAKALFGSCRWLLTDLMPKYGVETELVTGSDLDAWKRALSKPAKLVLIESPANPLLDAVDIEAVAALAHAAGAELIVDNVFASPILTRPLEHGADWVVYSCTKHMDGQGRALAGAILGKEQPMKDRIDPYLRHTGPACSPFNAWLVLKGLETLSLRVNAMSETAETVANAIADHALIQAVRYPGRRDHPDYAVHAKQMDRGGTLLALSLKGGEAAAFKFLNALQLIDISNNLGDAKSLATHPWTTTHRALEEAARRDMGLDDSWIRLSVGLEDAQDLIEDVRQALEVAGAQT